MRLKWTKRASKNLDDILAAIAADNSPVAQRLAIEWIQLVSQLVEFPLIGRVGALAGTRELVLHENTIAYYRVNASPKTVEIVRVLHTKRQFPGAR